MDPLSTKPPAVDHGGFIWSRMPSLLCLLLHMWVGFRITSEEIMQNVLEYASLTDGIKSLEGGGEDQGRTISPSWI
jgi:hypothetical protein